MTATQLYRRLCSDPFPGATVTLNGLGCNIRINDVYLTYDIEGWQTGGRILEHQLAHPGDADAEQVHAEIRRVLAVLKEYNALDSIGITSAQEAALSPLVRANRRALGLSPQEQASLTQSVVATSTYVALVALDGSGVWSVGKDLMDAQKRAANHRRKATGMHNFSDRECTHALRAITLVGDLDAIRVLVDSLDELESFVPVELREVEP